MGRSHWNLFMKILIGLLLLFTNPFCFGDTDLRDVAAINALFIALGYPPLRGWILVGGDPCGEKWQGVECVFSNITAIQLSGLNLGGELGTSLDQFESIISIDLSNNHIGGIIPSALPATLRSFSLSANQFTGSIPSALASLTQLMDLSINNNLLTGAIPDVFQLLNGLNNLDLSGNNLSGQLPPSMADLFSLTTLHLQNNRLSGMLDVLQDLPLSDLNIENNLFSGPIPAKLLGIPNFRKDGNPFNTTIIPSAPALAPSPFAVAPVTAGRPTRQTGAGQPLSSGSSESDGGRSFFSGKRIVWIVIIGAVILVALGACILLSVCLKRRSKHREEMKMVRENADMASKDKPKLTKPSVEVDDMEKGRRETTLKPVDRDGMKDRIMDYTSPKLHENPFASNTSFREDHTESFCDRRGANGKRKDASNMSFRDDHTESSSISIDELLARPPPPPPFSLLSTQEIAKPIVTADVPSRVPKKLNTSSLRVFTIASLQQYTNSFSEDNLLGKGMLGSVYRAELPNGRLLAVKKLDGSSLTRWNDDEFHNLVSDICEIRHDNIVELKGYCAEHGQYLLIYEYCENGTLYEALHVDKEMHQMLSWNVRVRIALGAARALEYLHEACQPPIVHQNFKSANILLDNELKAQLSDSGLASLLDNQSSVRFLPTHGYSAPEFESGTYTYQSDVFSFGVVMLELLTGRKSCDRTLPRGEQYLVRWAIPRLHDIDALSRMVDPSLKGTYPIKSLSRFADIISSCVMREPEFRPPISEIVQELLQMV
ncbi:protein STRUBBELIG-RECEPTOR FAMILY 3-like isoform X1 [Cucurbita maxima]|uniref:Protein STRUBBELIG-RECEPTOR FAMILY 3-like isoform X1 n=1 Tax=Cucurbita maxima TaxID=3661 RepID=A0A6J1INK3_CUCMA|nr:protein STRUBBELIG-RECEPTOR FAMILY 3-like isoform X1 [Cucurbita maxima]